VRLTPLASLTLRFIYRTGVAASDKSGKNLTFDNIILHSAQRGSVRGAAQDSVQSYGYALMMICHIMTITVTMYIQESTCVAGPYLCNSLPEFPELINCTATLKTRS